MPCLPDCRRLWALCCGGGSSTCFDVGSLQQLPPGHRILSLLVLTRCPARRTRDRALHRTCTPSRLHGRNSLPGDRNFSTGAVMSFISHSTVRGFTSAAALIICSTQIPGLLGIKVQGHEYLFPMLYDIVKGLSATHIPTLVIGLLTFAIIFVAKKYRATFPGDWPPSF